MSSEQTTELGEYVGRETEFCEWCRDEHDETELVPVIGGEVIGRYKHPEPHLAVAPFEDGPDAVLWCPHRYENEFGVEPTSETRQQFGWVRRWFSFETVAAFTTGVVLTYLLASVLIV